MHSMAFNLFLGMLGNATFPLCKPGVCVVNVARGGIIDEEALLRAIEKGQCGGAALDVFCEEPPKNSALLESDKIICTPHLGASTVEAQKKVAEEIAMEFIAMAEGKTINGLVGDGCITCLKLNPLVFLL